MHMLGPNPRSPDSQTLGLRSQQSVLIRPASTSGTCSSLRCIDVEVTHPHSDVLPARTDHILTNAGDTHVQ